MKKETFINLTICIFFVSCHFSCNNKVCTDLQIQSIGEVCFNEQIDSFLTDFLNETQEDSCIYELYVDKKNRGEYQLSLLCRRANNEYFQENHPANYTTIKNKTIFIYSGIEDFINKDTCSTNFKYISQSPPEYCRAWYKIILPDTSYIVKTNSSLINPFCTATLRGTVEFDPPELSKE